jgi:hypothetical protein
MVVQRRMAEEGAGLRRLGSTRAISNLLIRVKVLLKPRNASIQLVRSGLARHI